MNNIVITFRINSIFDKIQLALNSAIHFIFFLFFAGILFYFPIYTICRTMNFSVNTAGCGAIDEFNFVIRVGFTQYIAFYYFFCNQSSLFVTFSAI